MNVELNLLMKPLMGFCWLLLFIGLHVIMWFFYVVLIMKVVHKSAHFLIREKVRVIFQKLDDVAGQWGQCSGT